MSHIVVIGAGQAGSSLVAGLRKGGFDGAITLIGAEPVLPYQRPPLSKAYLLGEMELERLFMHGRYTIAPLCRNVSQPPRHLSEKLRDNR